MRTWSNSITILPNCYSNEVPKSSLLHLQFVSWRRTGTHILIYTQPESQQWLPSGPLVAPSWLPSNTLEYLASFKAPFHDETWGREVIIENLASLKALFHDETWKPKTLQTRKTPGGELTNKPDPFPLKSITPTRNLVGAASDLHHKITLSISRARRARRGRRPRSSRRSRHASFPRRLRRPRTPGAQEKTPKKPKTLQTRKTPKTPKTPKNSRLSVAQDEQDAQDSQEAQDVPDTQVSQDAKDTRELQTPKKKRPRSSRHSRRARLPRRRRRARTPDAQEKWSAAVETLALRLWRIYTHILIYTCVYIYIYVRSSL